MVFHPHVHFIVPSGGVGADGTKWVSTRPGFLFPEAVASPIYRQKFREALRAAGLESNVDPAVWNRYRTPTGTTRSTTPPMCSLRRRVATPGDPQSHRSRLGRTAFAASDSPQASGRLFRHRINAMSGKAMNDVVCSLTRCMPCSPKVRAVRHFCELWGDRQHNKRRSFDPSDRQQSIVTQNQGDSSPPAGQLESRLHQGIPESQNAFPIRVANRKKAVNFTHTAVL